MHSFPPLSCSSPFHKTCPSLRTSYCHQPQGTPVFVWMCNKEPVFNKLSDVCHLGRWKRSLSKPVKYYRVYNERRSQVETRGADVTACVCVRMKQVEGTGALLGAVLVEGATGCRTSSLTISVPLIKPTSAAID